MPDYSVHAEVLALLNESQDAEDDLRQQAREAHLFVDKRDGQWEPHWWNANKGKPRYTFDQTTPIIEQVSGELAKKDFDIKIKPGSGDTSKESAEVMDGIIRAIENMSDARRVYNCAARNGVTAGLDGWLITQKYVDDDSFDQDLAIEPIANYVDSVWFDASSKMQDASDARHCFVLEAIGSDAYKSKYPDGSGQSVGSGSDNSAYYHKADQIIIGQIYYIKEVDRTLYRMTDGSVYKSGPDFDAVVDELEAEGVTVELERKRKDRIVYSRLFDNKGWLGEEQKTVFSMLPVIPVYMNYKVFEDKRLYRGVVEKLMDAQRVYNYAKSREIEEGALAPRAKYWMTPKQASGFESTLGTMNTNSDPVQLYNPDSEAPGAPMQSGGAQINQGLMAVSESMRQTIGQVAGMFAANMGDNPGLQSGVAIEKLQDRGDVMTYSYQESLEIAISQTAKVLVDAIPKVYTTERQIQVIGSDGSDEVLALNKPIYDAQSGRIIIMNDISGGRYSVSCNAGPSFRSKQAETVAAVLEIGQVDPSVIELGGDILFSNMTAPGMDVIAARKRQQLMNAGMIPQSQMTEEELQQAQAAAQQPPPPDPGMLIAQAEIKKSEAQTQKVLVDAQAKSAELMLKERKDQRESVKQAQDAELNSSKLALQKQSIEFGQMMQAMQQQMAQQAQLVDLLNRQADTLTKLKDAIGADAIIAPGAVAAYSGQTEQVIDAQQEL